jgi:general secretion pathway protein F
MSVSGPALAPDDIVFRYTAVDRTGKQVRDVVRARDARAAARSLAAEGLTPITLTEEAIAGRSAKDRDLKFAERVAVLRQISLMIEAGVNLLEAMQTVAAGITATKGRLALEQVIAALKRGESFAAAMQTYAGGYPFYVYAMSRVGEATGELGGVLTQAAEQMAFEHKLRRDLRGAMIYPTFLMSFGLLVVMGIFIFMVPRFAIMVGDRTDKLPWISRVVFGASAFTNAHLPAVLITIGIVIVGPIVALSSPRAREGLYNFARGIPLTGPLIRWREIGAWARLLGFSLQSGVLLMEASSLARSGAPEGPFKRGLEQVERDLKSGVGVETAFGRHTELEAMDLSLLRAGAKSGQLAKMFLVIAERYEGRLRDGLKQLTTIMEPATIIFVAIMVALIAVAVMLSLVNVYSQIGQG